MYFFDSTPEVPRFFSGTDMQRQERMLQASLHMVMLASQDNGAAEIYLRHVASEHQQRQIPAFLFDLWLDCLIKTVAETDSRFNGKVAQAWHDIMSQGIEYMKKSGGQR
ncbi:MAG: globin [Steroidobacteraceae bacterium]